LAAPQKKKGKLKRRKKVRPQIYRRFFCVYAIWYWRARKLIYYSAHKFVGERNFWRRFMRIFLRRVLAQIFCIADQQNFAKHKTPAHN